MSPFLLYSGVSVVLFCLALHGLITRPHLLRKIMALNLMGGAVFLFLVAVAQRNRVEVAGTEAMTDAVPHAMVLTGIVVAVSATAFALALVRRLHAETGRVTLEEEEGVE